MSPTTLMNNYTLFSDEEIFNTSVQQFVGYLILMLTDLLQYIADKYAATFDSNHWLAFLIFCIVFYVAETIVQTANYADRLKELENQNQYLENKMKIQEGNMEFIYENHANNELKLQKLTKQMKKLQKEVNEYA